MFLKSLTLRGFKTFADITEIEIGPEARITAIVGPNGCGKSNLLDATRWALGEDNPRELRVATLDHIIFAGTANRKPLSLAEVSLIFDNSSAKLPIPYADVSIKRRTFREGESEFFINKNLCRLKDIKDLLLDTGLGEGSYSIITQGQVDAVLSSRGEERRAVFEEAAGINKYKTHKLAAEKKLIAAEQNILRINDLKIEVSEQLITQQEQARRAQEYLTLQNRVKELELGLGKKILGGLLEKRTKIEEELIKARRESEERQAAERADEAELKSAREELRNVEIKIEECFAKLDAEKDRLRDRELDRRFLEGELKREEKRREELEKRREEIKARLESLSPPSAPCPGVFPAGLSDPVNQLIEQARRLVDLLSVFLVGLGKGAVFSLTSPQEKNDTQQLKRELLREEEKRIEDEVERVAFAAAALHQQLEGLPSSSAETETKTTLLNDLNRLKVERETLAAHISCLEEKVRKDYQDSSTSSSLEIALAKLDGELNGLSEKYSIEYNITVEELKSHPSEVSSTPKARAEAEEGRLRLRSLEPVNLLAIEEFEKNRERLSFIEAQLADLNAARDNLRSLIVELDTRAEETFRQTMQQLSLIFSETFSRLFTGGEAKITLSAGPSALESEIEISVRPPGRKWLPLPLLSGGERALAAIAILFSLLKIRPSPFCFLDEVDAALDEANINRFTKLLKDFSSTSQILVITHNKCTMAAADNIYGVTMEEPGVSKIISMKLAEVYA